MYMEAMLGISLYSYMYLKLAKMLCLSYYLLHFSLTKLKKRAEQFCLEVMGEGEERGTGRPGVEAGKMAQTMCTHMNKCINNLKKKMWYYTQWDFIQPQTRMKFCHSQVNG
jgi:hypothetical protein